MKLPSIPQSIDDWNIEILNELIKYTDVESEILDFKKEPNKLYEHICAMANTSGGFLVLGINEVKSDDAKRIIKFEKVGFDNGEQDNLRNTIGNNIFNIEPPPKIEVKYLQENNRFYPIIKIKNEISKKPYFIKDRGQCYIRIENSTRPASRSIILNFFSGSLELRNNIEKLRVAVLLLKESLMHTSSDISAVQWESTMKIAPIDLVLIKNAIISSESFLRTNGLLGEHLSQSSYTEGFNSVLYKLEKVNAYIDAYNRESIADTRRQLWGQFLEWGVGSNSLLIMIKFLDKVVQLSDEFLSR